jgi:hypothetical protein
MITDQQLRSRIKSLEAEVIAEREKVVQLARIVRTFQKEIDAFRESTIGEPTPEKDGKRAIALLFGLHRLVVQRGWKIIAEKAGQLL